MSMFTRHATIFCREKGPLLRRWLCGFVKNPLEKVKVSKKYVSLVNFLKEPSTEVHLQQFSKDLACPFVDIKKIIEKIDSENPDFLERTPSALYDHCANGYIAKPAIDIQYIQDNVDEIEENMRLRKMKHVNVKDVVSAHKKLLKIEDEIKKYKEMFDVDKFETKKEEFPTQTSVTKDINFKKHILQFLLRLRKEMEKYYLVHALRIPNKTFAKTSDCHQRSNVLETIGNKPLFHHKIFNHVQIAKKLGILRQSYMSRMAGHRTYFLYGAGSELEHALSCFALDKLKEHNFIFLTVPNILKDAVFEGAGLFSRNQSHMVYNIENASEPDFSLSGTSELGICAFLSDHAIDFKDLPLKLCSVSTCYRRETGTRLDRAGLFRVHQFLKVEMFGVTANETGMESHDLHEEFVKIQKEIFSKLGLHFNVVDMPQNDLGLSAYRKIDIEAWFPGRDQYDEISSASNCVDFQARRLHIRYKKDNEYKFAHTINGTACAVPRLIIALLENGQTNMLKVKLPSCLKSYMNGRTVLKKENHSVLSYTGLQQSKSKQVH